MLYIFCVLRPNFSEVIAQVVSSKKGYQCISQTRSLSQFAQVDHDKDPNN